MNKRKIIIIGTMVIVAIYIVIIGRYIYSKNKNQAKAKNTQNQTSEYTIKQQISSSNMKADDIKSNKEFDVSDAKVKNNTLTVTVNTDITDSVEAYKTAVVIEKTIWNLNADKIKKDGIKKVEIILKGSQKSWMYDGDSYINEVTLK